MRIDEITRVLDLPNVRQATPDTCGPAAVKSVLGYYGIVATEKELIDAMRMDFRWGAEPEDMQRVMEEHGLEVEIKRGMTVDDLRLCTENGIPVIIVLQAWGDKDDYSEEWDDSHYVVVKGVSDETIRFEDPSSDFESELPIDEFVPRWHGWDKDIVGWGMLVGRGEHRVDPVHHWIEKMG